MRRLYARRRRRPRGEPTIAEFSAILAPMGPKAVAIDDLIGLSGASPASGRTRRLELDVPGRLDRPTSTVWILEIGRSKASSIEMPAKMVPQWRFGRINGN